MTPGMLTVDPTHPDPEIVHTVAQALVAGEVIILPTDTVYGLAAAVDQPEAIAALYRLKQRPARKPLARLAADIEQVVSEAGPLDALTRRLAEAFWPGGLTLVLECNGKPTGYRVPDLAITRALISRVGTPIIATSANQSGQPDPCTAEAARDFFPQESLLVLDGGPTPGPIPSTVVAVTDGKVQFLREGVIDKQRILDRLSPS